MKAEIFAKAVGRAATKIVGGERMLMLKKAQPKAMLIGGLGLIGIGVISACRGTLKMEKAVEEFSEEREFINRNVHERMKPKAKVQNVANLCAQTARNYIPAIICIGSGVALVVGSHNVMQSRIGALSAAYISLDGSYRAYRQRVIEEHGEEADRKYRLGISKEEVTETKTLKNGKTKEVRKVVDYFHNDGRPYSPYARFFDAFNSPTEWRNDPEYNYNLLRMKQAWANERFQQDGHLFLNDVYKELGMALVPDGQIVGWYKGLGDDFVDFGLLEVYNDPARDYVNGATECFVLDFNVDGPIYQLL